MNFFLSLIAFIITIQFAFSQPLTVSAGLDTVVCEGDSIQLNGSVSGGVPPYTILWQPSGGFNDPTILNPSVSLITDSTFVLSVTDSVGTMALDSVLVQVNSFPPIGDYFGTDATIQQGDSAQLFAAGGDSYTWSPVDGLSDPNGEFPKASPDSTTTYTVTINTNVGCSMTGEVTITVVPVGVPGMLVQNFSGGIYPNPASDVVQFRIAKTDWPNAENSWVEVFNTEGKLIRSEAIKPLLHANDNSITGAMNTANLVEGIYLIQIRNKAALLYAGQLIIQD